MSSLTILIIEYSNYKSVEVSDGSRKIKFERVSVLLWLEDVAGIRNLIVSSYSVRDILNCVVSVISIVGIFPFYFSFEGV